MTIAHVSDCYLPRIGGIEGQVDQLARRQAGSGRDVHVLTRTPGDGADPDESGITVHRLDRSSGFGAGPLLRPQARRAVAGVLNDIGPDAVHVHASVVSPLAFTAAVAAARAGLPTVVTVHSMWAYLSTPYRRIAALAGLGRLPIEWTAVSAAAARQVQHVLGSGRAVHLLPNGIDDEYWQRTPRTADGDHLVVAAVMRLNARKRPLAVLAALRRARAALPSNLPIRSVIIGGGPQRPLLEAYLRAHHMRGWVHLAGPGDSEQVRALLAQADVFLSAARRESFGVAALEARCAGVPIVARAGTGIADFVRHGREGLLMSSDAELSTALTRILASVDLRAAMSRRTGLDGPRFGWSVTLAAAGRAYDRAAAMTAPMSSAQLSLLAGQRG